jgi:uncharacterized protein (DUF1778 family)
MEAGQKPPELPVFSKKGNKSAWLNLRITPEEKASIQDRAQAAGQNVNEYMRRAGLGLEVKERLPLELKQALIATSKNLNQYLKLAHMGRLEGADATAMQAIIQALNQALR